MPKQENTISGKKTIICNLTVDYIIYTYSTNITHTPKKKVLPVPPKTAVKWLALPAASASLRANSAPADQGLSEEKTAWDSNNRFLKCLLLLLLSGVLLLLLFIYYFCCFIVLHVYFSCFSSGVPCFLILGSLICNKEQNLLLFR